MKEAAIRKGHRFLGICLVFFMILQAISGLFLTIGDWNEPHDHYMHAERGMTQEDYRGGAAQPHGGPDLDEEESAWLKASISIHHRGGLPGAFYRIALSMGIIGMALSGALIFMKTRQRLNRVKKNKSNNLKFK